MQKREYIVGTKSLADSESLLRDMRDQGGSDTIPAGSIDPHMERPSSVNTNYLLSEEQLVILHRDPRVAYIEEAEIIRNSVEPIWEQTAQFSRSNSPKPLSGHKNWGLLRCSEGTIRERTDDVDLTVVCPLEGEHVDIVICDGGLRADHPEFAVNSNGTGGSRVVPLNWFQYDSIVLGKNTDRVFNYNTWIASHSSSDDANHGCHVAGTAAGNTNGWARKANIYNIGPFASNYLGADVVYDYIRAFHLNKPINPITKRKNPTIVNSSWTQITSAPTKIIASRINGVLNRAEDIDIPEFNGDTSSFDINRVPTRFLSNNILRGQTTGGGSRLPLFSQAIAADVKACLEAGIILVAAAGNDNIFLAGPKDPSYNDVIYVYNDRTLRVDVIPFRRNASIQSASPEIIRVGSTSNIITNGMDTKASYSNFGSGITVWAPGTKILSSIQNKNSWGQGANTLQDNRNRSFYFVKISGTSMASPQVAGVLACAMQENQDMTPQAANDLLEISSKTNQISLDASSPNRHLTLSSSVLPPQTPTKPRIYSETNVIGKINLNFIYNIRATNYPTSFSANNIPEGLIIDSINGKISGVPTLTGVFTPQIVAINPYGEDVKTLTITIRPSTANLDPTTPPPLPPYSGPPPPSAVPIVYGLSSIDVVVNKPFEYLVQATNSPSYINITGAPQGSTFVFNPSGNSVFKGTPWQKGIFNAKIIASNIIGSSIPFPLTINVLNPSQPPVLKTPVPMYTRLNSSFSYQVTSNPTSAVSYNIFGSIPPGISINSSSGLISGIPTRTGAFAIGIGATNIYGSSPPVYLVLFVTSPTISTPRR